MEKFKIDNYFSDIDMRTKKMVLAKLKQRLIVRRQYFEQITGNLINDLPLTKVTYIMKLNENIIVEILNKIFLTETKRFKKDLVEKLQSALILPKILFDNIGRGEILIVVEIIIFEIKVLIKEYHGEMFSYIQSHNLSNNMIKIVKDKQTKLTVVDLRKLYTNKYYLPTADEVVSYLRKYKKVNIIIFPILENNENHLLETNNVGSVSQYSEFKLFFESIFKVIKTIEKYEKLTIIIPYFDNFEVYYFWYIAIKKYLSNKVKVGFIMKNNEEIYDIEMPFYIDYCLIDIEKIVENIGLKTNINYDTFKDELVPRLRDVHSYFLETTIDHGVKFSEINDPEIIEKLMKMGFRNFQFNSKTYQNVRKSYKNFHERRNNYRLMREK